MNRWLYVAVAVGVAVALVGGTYLLRGASADGESGRGLLASLSSGDSGTRSETRENGSEGGALPSPGDMAAAPDSPNSVAKPADPGAPLEPVTEPPGKTIAMFSPDRLPAGARLDVEFQPFGTGPWGPDSLVIRMISVTLVSGDVSDVSYLVGGNAIVRLEPQAASVVKQGGTFMGVLRSVADDDVTVLSVVEAKPVER